MAILLLDYPILSYCIAVAFFIAQTVLMALK
ncbi:phage capsid protein, partial [Staphylococcus pseudintermedius]|nr:phage capsid protein [Staphylococcus pseudintermedius]